MVLAECLTPLCGDSTVLTFLFTSLAGTSDVIEVPSECCFTKVHYSIRFFGEFIIVWAIIIISEGYGDAFINSHAIPWKIRDVCIIWRQIPVLASIVTKTRSWANYSIWICWYETSWTTYQLLMIEVVCTHQFLSLLRWASEVGIVSMVPQVGWRWWHGACNRLQSLCKGQEHGDPGSWHLQSMITACLMRHTMVGRSKAGTGSGSQAHVCCTCEMNKF